MFIHTFIFCWSGKTENALNICRGLYAKTDRLTVLDASPGAEPNIDGINGIEWRKVNPQFYYGMKFRTAVDLHRGDVLLQVQEDAFCDDWGRIVDLCRERFSTISNLGIWSPDLDYTAHSTNSVKLAPLQDPMLRAVVQTDCIVWALNRATVEYLRTLNYTGNNLGWGIDWAASAYAFSNRMLVVRDSAALVTHPQGTSYRHDEARSQMRWFLAQLNETERLQYMLLYNYRFRRA
jgi:O-antigen biosynthesis protein